MGNQASPCSRAAASPIRDLVAALQRDLIASRALVGSSSSSSSSTCSTSLPRSTKVNGRFVLDPKHFPGAVEYSSFRDLLTWRYNAEAKPTYTAEYLERELPVQILSKEVLVAGAAEGNMQVTWLGHASVLAQWGGWNVIVDPIFSERCSPSQWIGPARLRPSPVKDNAHVLPNLDMCCISHNHYDHLDLNSITELSSLFPDMIYCVPLGMKQWMEESGVQNPILEMDWSEKATISDTSSAKREPATIHCIPCQHWCARGRHDRNKCLWCAWRISTAKGSFFFGGDTGYCPGIFKQVPTSIITNDCTDREEKGSAATTASTTISTVEVPTSVAALPIGAYGSDGEKWFHKPSHMNPEEAVLTHLDIKAKTSVGVHWGTFMLTGEDIMEPPKLLEQAKKTHGVADDAFVVLKHGETRSFSL